MEQVQNDNVCPKCGGSGQIQAFQHIKAGVCFSCWGTGTNLARQLRAAHRAYQKARFEWRCIAAAMRASKSEPQVQAYGKYLKQIEARGRKARADLERVIAYRDSLAQRYKQG